MSSRTYLATSTAMQRCPLTSFRVLSCLPFFLMQIDTASTSFRPHLSPPFSLSRPAQRKIGNQMSEGRTDSGPSLDHRCSSFVTFSFLSLPVFFSSSSSSRQRRAAGTASSLPGRPRQHQQRASHSFPCCCSASSSSPCGCACRARSSGTTRTSRSL
jgi:hypothetical protein